MASRNSHAFLVASGILLSRLAGLVRERVFAACFGNSDAADAFKAALRIPNVLQNLFGEGVLSASFIPTYARLRDQGKHDEARALANVVGSFLLLAVSVLVLGGTLGAEWLVDVLAPGFHDEKRALTAQLVQILFPAIGLLVLSAWCLGVLNSHRKFFLPYAAPVLWSGTIIAVLLLWRRDTPLDELARIGAWGVVAGSFVQFVVQLPLALSLTGGFRFQLDKTREGVTQVFRSFVPVVGARGVVQISAWVDTLIASLLPAGAVAALSYAQTIYVLPISLFGMSVSAAELPELSSIADTNNEAAAHIRARINRALERIAFFVVPTAVAFVFGGDLLAAALFQTGRFSASDSQYVWGILAGSAVGLTAATGGRLYASAFYAYRNTRIPFYCATARVLLSVVLGYLLAVYVPGWLGLEARWGAAGITIASGFAAWVEFGLLKRSLARLVGATGIGRMPLITFWSASLGAAAIATSARLAEVPLHPIVRAGIFIALFGTVYLSWTWIRGTQDARALVNRIRR